jgi:hypothetical protein
VPDLYVTIMHAIFYPFAGNIYSKKLSTDGSENHFFNRYIISTLPASIANEAFAQVAKT